MAIIVIFLKKKEEYCCMASLDRHGNIDDFRLKDAI